MLRLDCNLSCYLDWIFEACTTRTSSTASSKLPSGLRLAGLTKFVQANMKYNHHFLQVKSVQLGIRLILGQSLSIINACREMDFCRFMVRPFSRADEISKSEANHARPTMLPDGLCNIIRV